MKATLTGLAVLVVSTIALNPASAQTPEPYQYPVTAAGYGYPGYAPGPTYGPVEGAATGGCASCGKGGGLLSKLGLKDGGCATCGLGKRGGCDGPLGGKCKGWLCRPYPSDAPVLWHYEYPLGFKNHPYVRSPRDYFMWNDP